MSFDVQRWFRRCEFGRRWLAYTREFEYPECYSAFSLLVAASAAINGRILVNAGYKPETAPNLFVLLYGPSGARKSEALLDATHQLMAEAVPSVPILPMNSTPEALRARLVHDSRCPGVKNELECVNETHYGAAKGVVICEEFTSLVGGAEYQQHGAEFLSKMWETRAFETFATITHGEEVVRHRYVVLGACTTPKSFRKIDFDSIEGGLLRRLLIVASLDGQKESPRPAVNWTLLHELRATFAERFGEQAFGYETMALTPAAAEVNERWYTTELRKWRVRAQGEKAAKFVNSLQVHAFKIAAILELLNGGRPDAMSAESLEDAFEIVTDLLPATFQVYDALISTALGRLKAATYELLAAAGHSMSDMELDTAVGAENGVDGDVAAKARRALLMEKKILRREDGRLDIPRRKS